MWNLNEVARTGVRPSGHHATSRENVGTNVPPNGSAEADVAMTADDSSASRKGSNSVQVRHYNERVVLDAIRRRGLASKADVARHAHLTPPAVASIVDALVDAGYVEQKGKRFGQKGQPSVMYGIAPEGGFSIGLHIGRRSLDAVLVEVSGAIRTSESHEYEFPEPELVRRIGGGLITQMRNQLGRHATRLIGLGISAPYFLGGWESEL